MENIPPHPHYRFGSLFFFFKGVKKQYYNYVSKLLCSNKLKIFRKRKRILSLLEVSSRKQVGGETRVCQAKTNEHCSVIVCKQWDATRQYCGISEGEGAVLGFVDEVPSIYPTQKQLMPNSPGTNLHIVQSHRHFLGVHCIPLPQPTQLAGLPFWGPQSLQASVTPFLPDSHLISWLSCDWASKKEQKPKDRERMERQGTRGPRT
jgi:hypothetical protein